MPVEEPPPLQQQLAALLPRLLRTARSKLHNADWAQDAVASTVLAALERPPPFLQPDRVRAWVMGVLRHKLVDELRRHGGSQPLHCVGDASDVDLLATAHLGNHHGDPADPCEALHRARLGPALARAMAGLPGLQARAFELSQWTGCDGADICRELGIKPGHLGVLLHRARRGLQRQLQDWRP